MSTAMNWRKFSGLSIDLHSRPHDYWHDERAIFANICGQLRREHIRECIRNGTVAWLEPHFFASRLPPHLRAELGTMDTKVAGGEHLPPVGTGEVEVARVCMGCEHVISVRAKRRNAHLIHYRVVQDHDRKDLNRWLSLEFVGSSAPVTLLQLSYMLDTILPINHDLEYNPPEGFVAGLWRRVAENHGLDAVVTTVNVESEFYPDLQKLYQWRAAKWVSSVRTRPQPDQFRSAATQRPACRRPIPPGYWKALCGSNPPVIGLDLLLALESLFVENRTIGIVNCCEAAAKALTGRGSAVLKYLECAPSPAASRLVRALHHMARQPLLNSGTAAAEDNNRAIRTIRKELGLD